MNRRQQLLAALPPAGDTCTLCGQFVPANKIVRLDSDHCRCPHCGGDYLVTVHPNWSQCAK